MRVRRVAGARACAGISLQVRWGMARHFVEGCRGDGSIRLTNKRSCVMSSCRAVASSMVVQTRCPSRAVSCRVTLITTISTAAHPWSRGSGRCRAGAATSGRGSARPGWTRAGRPACRHRFSARRRTAIVSTKLLQRGDGAIRRHRVQRTQREGSGGSGDTGIAGWSKRHRARKLCGGGGVSGQFERCDGRYRLTQDLPSPC